MEKKYKKLKEVEIQYKDKGETKTAVTNLYQKIEPGFLLSFNSPEQVRQGTDRVQDLVIRYSLAGEGSTHTEWTSSQDLDEIREEFLEKATYKGKHCEFFEYGVLKESYVLSFKMGEDKDA